MTHRSAAWLVVLATLMWSMAGVVSRWLHGTPGMEMVFWRSLSAAVAGFALLKWQGAEGLLKLRSAPRALWVSGVCWGVMFTCFMLALTLTTVANVLIIQSLGPVFTALMVRVLLRRPLAARTWCAMIAAAAGVALMYVGDVSDVHGAHALGMLLALCIPLTGAVNLIVLQRSGSSVDLRAAVMIGAAISALIALPLALPLRAGLHDIAWLGFLGAFQLALPCVLLVVAARYLAAHEVALLALLEIIFGVAWAWAFAGEAPGALALTGGVIVLAVLALHEWYSVRVNK